MAEQTRTWWSRAILLGAVIALVLLPVSALGSRLGLWSFQTGFLGLAAATVLAAIGAVVGLVAIIAAHKRDLPADKPLVYAGSIISAVVLGLMGAQFYTASSVPPIHNISTDVADPPPFQAVVALRGEQSNPLEYDADKIAPLQQEAYPWVKPYQSDDPPDAVFNRALAVLQNMGLEIVNTDPATGVIEATATTFWFGFKDDVAVRVRPSAEGSVVDVRSVSRVGLSDLGANADRIRKFFERMAGAG